MTVTCSNNTCHTQYHLDVSKLPIGSWQNMRCKCGQDTKFQVVSAQVASPANIAASAQLVSPAKISTGQALKTQVLEDVPPTAPEQIGWLVVHDENTHTQTLPLTEGRSVIGRKSPEKPCHIMIDTLDQRMSRNHAVIEVIKRPNGHYQYLISDCGSTNGTFINGNDTHKLSPQDQVYLKDGDTIQLGRTKVVLKTGQTVGSSAEARQEVGKKDYHKTVVL